MSDSNREWGENTDEAIQRRNVSDGVTKPMNTDDERPCPEVITLDKSWRQRQRADAAEAERDDYRDLLANSFPVKALRELDSTGSAGFITASSLAYEKRFQVVARFKTVEEMQAFYQALMNCGRAVREMDEPEETGDGFGAGNAGGSVGPFSHDAGGGKRNVRGTKSMT